MELLALSILALVVPLSMLCVKSGLVWLNAWGLLAAAASLPVAKFQRHWLFRLFFWLLAALLIATFLVCQFHIEIQDRHFKMAIPFFHLLGVISIIAIVNVLFDMHGAARQYVEKHSGDETADEEIATHVDEDCQAILASEAMTRASGVWQLCVLAAIVQGLLLWRKFGEPELHFSALGMYLLIAPIAVALAIPGRLGMLSSLALKPITRKDIAFRLTKRCIQDFLTLSIQCFGFAALWAALLAFFSRSLFLERFLWSALLSLNLSAIAFGVALATAPFIITRVRRKRTENWSVKDVPLTLVYVLAAACFVLTIGFGISPKPMALWTLVCLPVSGILAFAANKMFLRADLD